MRYPRIEERRNALGISRRQLSEMMGVTPGHLAAWVERGNIPPWALRRFSELLQCSAEYLLGRCDDITACVQ